MSPLTGLKQLDMLWIGGNPIKNAGVQRLAELKQLRFLSLYKGQISNVKPLAKLTKLERLYLDTNQISDISALSKLAKLERLHLVNNQISDISALSKLANLQDLDLRSNKIRHVNALVGLTKLRDLKLRRNPIQDTTPLQKLLAKNPDMKLDIEVVGVGAAPTAVAERPTETALLANFPNPFNPETWIPYELARDTDVKITIYNAQGVVVRTLALGHQSAGYYTGRARAAYWDGRNTVGEPVASGLYFYTFTAGDFVATRRLLILK